MASLMRLLPKNAKVPLSRTVWWARMQATPGHSIAKANDPTMADLTSTAGSGFVLSSSVSKLMAKRELATPIWFAVPGSRRSYAAGGEGDEVTKGNEEYLEAGQIFGGAKRFAVGTTALDLEELVEQSDREVKEKAKEILLEVGEKLNEVRISGETVEETKLRKLHEKLVSTEGIGDLVQDMYNQKEEHAEVTQVGAGGN